MAGSDDRFYGLVKAMNKKELLTVSYITHLRKE